MFSVEKVNRIPLQDAALRQSDSLVGSAHTSPSPVPYASPGSITDAVDPVGNGAPQQLYQDQFYQSVPDDFMHRQHGPGALPTTRSHVRESHHSKSMAAARSALLEMQSQGLTYQNIQELVQNIQDLLNCLRVCHAWNFSYEHYVFCPFVDLARLVSFVVLFMCCVCADDQF